MLMWGGKGAGGAQAQNLNIRPSDLLLGGAGGRLEGLGASEGLAKKRRLVRYQLPE